MTRCNQGARDTWECTEKYQTKMDLPLLENGSIFLDGQRIFHSTNHLIQSYDSNRVELEYIQHKFPHYYYLVDVDACHYFPKILDVGQLKYIVGFNHFSVHDKLINKLVDDRCDACGELETQEHVLVCPCERKTSLNFLLQLEQTLKKQLSDDRLNGDIDLMLSNIWEFILGRESTSGTQKLIGYKNLFRGFVVRDQFGADQSTTTYKKSNIILVKACVKHYGIMWKKRNDRRYCDSVRRERLLQWAFREKNNPKNARKVKTSTYIQRGYEKVTKMSADAIQRQLIDLYTIRKSDT